MPSRRFQERLAQSQARRKQRRAEFQELLRILQAPRPVPPPVPEPEPEPSPGITGPAVARGLGGLLSIPLAAATMPWYGAGGALAAATGETLAQAMEGDFRPKAIAVEAGLGAVPYRKLFKAAKVAESVARGATYAGGGEVLRALAHERELDPARILGATAIGGGTSALLARLFKLGQVPAPQAPVPTALARLIGRSGEVKAAKPVPIPPVQGEAVPVPRVAETTERRFEQLLGRAETSAMRRRREAERIAEQARKTEEEAGALQRIEEQREALGLTDRSVSIGQTTAAKIPGEATRVSMRETFRRPLKELKETPEQAVKPPGPDQQPRLPEGLPPEVAAQVEQTQQKVAGALGVSPLRVLRTTTPTDLVDIERARYKALQQMFKAGFVPTRNAAKAAAEGPLAEAKRAADIVDLPPGGARAQQKAVRRAATGQVSPAEMRQVSPEELQRIRQSLGHRPGPPGLLGPERGAAQLGPLVHLLGGAIGGTAGLALDPLDEPLVSGALGALLGAAAPSILSRMSQVAPQAAATLPREIAPVVEAAQTPKGMTSITQELIKLLPQVVRTNLLMGVNLPSNAIAAPYGGALLKGLELHLAGDPRGAKFLQLLTPQNWAKTYWSVGLREATELIRRAQAGTATGMERAEIELTQLSRLVPPGVQAAVNSPGIAIAAGDATSRHLGKLVGLTEDEVRAFTLTSEPITKLGRAIANFQRAGPTGQLLLPFARTLVDIVEQGAMRTPLVGGPITRAFARQNPRFVPPSEEIQRIQRMFGGGALAAGTGAGYGIERSDAPPMAKRFLRGMAQNVAGPYSLLAGAGLAAGTALGAGAFPEKALAAGLAEPLQQLPLPSTDIPMTGYSLLREYLLPAAFGRPQELERLISDPREFARRTPGLTPAVFRQYEAATREMSKVRKPRPPRRSRRGP